MSSLYTLLLISLVLGPGGYAGPACVHRQWGSVDECASACGARWGWPGAAMGTDPWGAVIHQVALDTDMDAIVRQACADALAVITSCVRGVVIQQRG